MWWPDQRSAGNWFARLAATLAVAACTGGCFQPLYADRSVDGGPGLRSALGTVDVKQIDASKGTDEARLAVEIRNTLIFDLTGGGPASAAGHEPVQACEVAWQLVDNACGSGGQHL